MLSLNSFNLPHKDPKFNSLCSSPFPCLCSAALVISSVIQKDLLSIWPANTHVTPSLGWPAVGRTYRLSLKRDHRTSGYSLGHSCGWLSLTHCFPLQENKAPLWLCQWLFSPSKTFPWMRIYFWMRIQRRKSNISTRSLGQQCLTTTTGGPDWALPQGLFPRALLPITSWWEQVAYNVWRRFSHPLFPLAYEKPREVVITTVQCSAAMALHLPLMQCLPSSVSVGF